MARRRTRLQKTALRTAAPRRPGHPHRRILCRVGAACAEWRPRPKGARTLPPHNALRSCHITPEVNGCAVPLHGPQEATRSGDCRGPRYGQDRGRCAWGARHSARLECTHDPLQHCLLRLHPEVRFRLRRPVGLARRSASASGRGGPGPARAGAHDRTGGRDLRHGAGGLSDLAGRSADRRLPLGGRTDRTRCGPGARHDAIDRPGLRRIGGGRHRTSGSHSQGKSGRCSDAGLRTHPGCGVGDLDGRDRRGLDGLADRGAART